MRGTLFCGLIALLCCGGDATPLAAQEGLVVRQLRFEGNRALDDLLLAASIATTKSSGFATFPVLRALGLGEKRRLDELEFLSDVLRLRLYYRIARIPRECRSTRSSVGPTSDVYITFRIEEGEPVRVRTLEISGFDDVPGGREFAEDLPLRVGDPHSRIALTATADTIAERLRDRGYPTATVYLDRNAVDSAHRVADLSLRVVAGTPAIIGSITRSGPPRSTPRSSAHSPPPIWAAPTGSAIWWRVSAICTAPTCFGLPMSASTPPSSGSATRLYRCSSRSTRAGSTAAAPRRDLVPRIASAVGRVDGAATSSAMAARWTSRPMCPRSESASRSTGARARAGSATNWPTTRSVRGRPTTRSAPRSGSRPSCRRTIGSRLRCSANVGPSSRPTCGRTSVAASP